MPRHHSLAALGLFLAVAVVGCRSQKPPPQMPTPKVTVTRPASAEVRDYWQYNGFLAPSETVEVRARVKGFLTKRLFREGAEVRGKDAGGEGTEQYKGDLLYEIDRQPLEAILAQARADQATAEARLAKSDNDVARYKPLVAKQAVSQRELDDAQVAAEMAADAGDHVDDLVADLLGNLGKLTAIELAEIARRVDRIE